MLECFCLAAHSYLVLRMGEWRARYAVTALRARKMDSAAQSAARAMR
jgi:hypothetical protein